jgi:hypothetical protein
MASENSPEPASQLELVHSISKLAARTIAVPAWYWLLLGAAFGVLIFGVSTGLSFLAFVLGWSAAALVAFNGWLLARRKGLRILQRSDGVAANVLFLPLLIVYAGFTVLGWWLRASTGELWPAAAISILAVPVTLLFGFAYDRARFRSVGGGPRP